MSETDIVEDTAVNIAQVLIQGDLSRLTPEQKTNYYLKVCESLRLNPFTKPFGYIRFRDGGEQLYALKNCTDQLRDINKVSVMSLDRQRDGDIISVIASVRTPDGRTDSALGAVPIKGLYGDALANAYMKAETKAKRRATLSICGLGWTDESEVGSIPDAQVIDGPALPEPSGPPYVPTREQDVQDGPQRPPARAQERMVTSADERVWKRWEEVRSEALKYAIVPPNLGLPVGYNQLISQATLLKAKIEAAQAQLDREEEARRQAQVSSPEGAEPNADNVWARNRWLMAEAYRAGFKLRELPNDSALDQVELRNGELEQLLEQHEAKA